MGPPRLLDFAQPSGICGKVIPSINATEGSRAVFGRFNVVDMNTTWTIGSASTGGGTKVTELVVSSLG